jgi:hypothetical protein
MTRDVLVHTAMGEGDAQIVRAFLESNEIVCDLRGEALRNTHGFTIDGLGEVRIYVAEPDAAKAKQLMAQVAAGELEIPDD